METEILNLQTVEPSTLPAPVPLASLSPTSGLSADEIRELLNAFLSGRKETTLKAYAADLQDFAGFLGVTEPVIALQHFLSHGSGRANALALAYRAAMMDRNLTPATVNRRLAALRSVVKMGRVLGHIAWELEVPGLKSESYRDTRGPGREGFKALLKAAGRQRGHKALRDTAILHLLYDLALRRGEAINLDLGDVDLQAGTVAIVGKGRNEKQLLTLPAPTLAALKSWSEVRGTAPGSFFTNFDHAGKGDRLTGQSVARMVKRLGSQMGITARPHGLRHAAITAALDLTNGNVREVQKFSRHRDLQTVCLYDDSRTDTGGKIASLVAEAV
jgi:integrase/recombinase XerC